MKFFPFPASVPVIVVDDFYDQTELSLLWKELNFLTEASKFKPPKETGAAKASKDGDDYLKSAHGIWIDNVYADRTASNILSLNRKVFCKDFINKAKSINPLYCILENIDSDHTLLNYYEHNEEYKKHKDQSVFTAVTMFIKDEGNFSGGDFVIHDYDLLVEKRNNRLILFPGNLEHSVTPVQMKVPYEPFGGDGRYTVTQFMRVIGNTE